MTPIITISYDMDTEAYTLMATSFLRTEPAGERLFHGGDLPSIQWQHTDEAAANTDAATLQAYVNAAWSGKTPKAKWREERPAPEVDLSNAVWTL